MALSYTEITLGSGTGENGHLGTVFGPFGFEYLNTGDIKVQVRAAAGTTWTSLTIAADGVNTTTKKVTLTGTPAGAASSVATDVLRIFRSSSLEALVDFQNGSRLSEADLDTAYRQGLFAAQEAAEDAPGSGGVTMQTSETITDGAIIASKLASTLDLSGKTLTIPTATVTTGDMVTALKGALTLGSSMSGTLPTANGGTGSANATYCNLAANVNGVLPVAKGGTGATTQVNKVLEEMYQPCDGNDWTSGAGAVTIATVAAEFDFDNTAFTDVSGSSITYTPPSGTKTVVYKFVSHLAADANEEVFSYFRLWLDSAEVTAAKQTRVSSANDAGRVVIEWAFPIGGVAAAATGRVNTWTSDKTIKVQVRGHSGSYSPGALHSTYMDAADTGTAEGTGNFCCPLIGIKAIG
jgi:hypothetical protein